MKNQTSYQPKPVFIDAFPDVSGNTVNGLGETEVRRAAPFFWHPPERQTHGELQTAVLTYHQQSAEIRENFSPTPPGGRGPRAIEQNTQRADKTAAAWTQQVKEFSLANEADLVGIAAMDPQYVYEGYEI